MKYMKFVFVLVVSMFLFSCNSDSSKETVKETATPVEERTSPIRVACVGDSITEGTGIRHPSKDSYPAQLSGFMGEGWEIRNFGHKGTTLLKEGNSPYWNSNEYTASHAYNPDIVVIMLGTNDAKPMNWTKKSQFIADYIALIKGYKNLSSKPVVYVCYPPPVYGVFQGITNARIQNELIPKLTQIAAHFGLATIDIHSVLSGKKDLFPDKIHPNVEGARQLAKAVYAVIH